MKYLSLLKNVLVSALLLACCGTGKATTYQYTGTDCIPRSNVEILTGEAWTDGEAIYRYQQIQQPSDSGSVHTDSAKYKYLTFNGVTPSEDDKIVRFLIVCEGERTEPNCFKELVRNKYSEVRSEDIVGEGRSSCALVKRTEEIREKLEHQRQLRFDRVWVVFDKDDFNDFNEAIVLAERKGYKAAWSNEAFELWYLLHFIYLDAAISRTDYIKKLENEIRRFDGHENFCYKKNDPGIYALLQNIGNEIQAKLRAARLRSMFDNALDFKSHKPCTCVDILVEELEHPGNLLEGM